jgi:hypothetical protein
MEERMRHRFLALTPIALGLAFATEASADQVGYVAPSNTTSTTETRNATTSSTTIVSDEDAYEDRDDRPRVSPGIGLEVIGVAGTTEESRLGVGGRLEFVTRLGLTLGGSFTQHFNTTSGDAEKTAVRPLLGEVGWAIPIASRVEIRPMVGIGYAFVNTQSSGSSNTNASAASGSIATSGFDVAPGAKVSFGGNGLQVYTMPKYHIIKDTSFGALEVGAGLRF